MRRRSIGASAEEATGLGRRPVLLAGLATMATTGLVSCGSGSGTTTSSGGSGSSSGSGSGSGSKNLVKVSDVPVGGSVSATGADGKPIIVSQPDKGHIVAFTAICTHMGCTVAPAGAKLQCPCHGSVYDAFTGKNLTGPAPSPLAAIQVKVAGNEVVAG